MTTSSGVSPVLSITEAPAKAMADMTPLLSKCIPFTEDDDVKFAEPWEAKAFAIILKLTSAGHFTWSEWVDCFALEVRAATAAEANGQAAPSYYEQWLAAAEKLVIAKGLTSPEQLLAKKFAITSAGPAHLLK